MPPPASTRAWRGCRFGSVRIASPVGISARRPADLKMVLPQRRAPVECSEMLGRSGLLGLAVAGLAWAAAAPVEVEVRGVRLDPTTGSPVVQLVEKGKGARELPIWIGPFEAQAIAAEMQGVPLPRPLTHDLMKRLVESLGGRLDRVVIGDLRDNTYFATLHLAGADGKDISLDARPSDAIALALRLHGPILVADEVFAKSRAAHATPAAAHLWGLTVQDLTPEIAVFFKAPEAKGVLISDVGDDAPAHEALRGDVITALDGEPVHSVGELADRAGARATAEPVRLSLRRGARDLTITFAAR